MAETKTYGMATAKARAKTGTRGTINDPLPTKKKKNVGTGVSVAGAASNIQQRKRANKRALHGS